MACSISSFELCISYTVCVYLLVFLRYAISLNQFVYVINYIQRACTVMHAITRSNNNCVCSITAYVCAYRCVVNVRTLCMLCLAFMSKHAILQLSKHLPGDVIALLLNHTHYSLSVTNTK